MQRRALIAGSDGDVGRATVASFAAAGYETIGLSRAARHTEHLSRALSVDLGDRAALAAVAEGLPHVDVVINAAGSYRRTETEALDADMVRDNLGVAENILAIFTARLKDQPGSRIITIGSIDGVHPNRNSFSYSVAKAGIRTLVELYRSTYRASPINFDLISPGGINTRMRAAKQEDKTRLLQASDVAAFCVFLASLGAEVSVDEIVLSPRSFTYST
jgi:NADP-dependent 3-hydroxy acid dehydrogenase YdfG